MRLSLEAARPSGSMIVHAKRGDTAECGETGPWILIGGPVTCQVCRRAQLGIGP